MFTLPSRYFDAGTEGAKRDSSSYEVPVTTEPQRYFFSFFSSHSLLSCFPEVSSILVDGYKPNLFNFKK